MRIYFCGSILGGRGHLAVYQHIVEHLQAAGHVVPTEHVAHPDVLAEESALSPRAVYERDIAWLQGSDLMIAEISTPSLGVGFEIACGLQQGIPVLCLYRYGLSVSKMITGNPAPNLQVRTYRDLPEVDSHIDEFLGSLSASNL
jgi:2'-deoxynucleoside 5'-phosphate N-hydrolase